MSTKKTSKAYDEALAELIEVMEKNVADLDNNCFFILTNAIKKFLGVNSRSKADKICEQIVTLLPMNKVNAVGRAFLTGALSENFGRIDLLLVIANFEIKKATEVCDLIRKLIGLSPDPHTVGQDILDAENRSHEKMVERMEEKEVIPEAKPTIAFVLDMEDFLPGRDNKYYKLPHIFSWSHSAQAKEKRPVMLSWVTNTDTDMHIMYQKLKDDASIAMIQKLYSLGRPLTVQENNAINHLSNNPIGWARLLDDDNYATMGYYTGEPLWEDIDTAERAIEELAELTKNTKSD